MSKKYQNLLSPFKVGNVVFKNRMLKAVSKPHFVQGPQPYPSEAFIAHFAKIAEDGAALLSMGGMYFVEKPVPVLTIHDVPSYGTYRVSVGGQTAVGPQDYREVYFPQLTEALHFYGSKAEMGITADIPNRYDVSPGIPPELGGTRMGEGEKEEIPEEMLEKIADDYALQAAFFKEMGYDSVFLHMSYRMQLLGRFLSPITNKRTDKYGGSLENRARFPIMVADRIRQKCGPDLIIHGAISGTEDLPGGLTLEDCVGYAKLFAGHLDLLMVRAGDFNVAHPIAFHPERTPSLSMAEAIKKSGAKIAVVTSGGYFDLDLCEEIIASGKADFITMARAWISNPDFGRKAYEGRGEDVVPCLRCEKCHYRSPDDPFTSSCSVNPTWGLEHMIDRMIKPPTTKKKVVVVGGGPAGMEAALVATDRGHQVTLYEKSDTLGGLLKTADNVSFKWPLKDFKDYLIRQIAKSNVKVYLNTEATPEMLKGEEYDAVLAAVGSEPIVPLIPGATGKNVVLAQDVYGNEDALTENVVVIGGGEVGVETGIHLVEKGHKVTVLEMEEALMPDAAPVHYYDVVKAYWEKLENFKFILQARCNGIGEDKVTYIDADGKEQSIPAGSVVIALGYKPKNELALEFYGVGDRFFMIGDCSVANAGTVQKAMRSAFSITSML